MRCPDSERRRRILVASDFSRSADEAIRQADAWARRQQAKLSALHVVREALPVHPLFPQRQQRDVTDLVTLERGLAQELSDRIRRLSESSRDEVDVAVDFGDPGAVGGERAAGL